jgi:hypothetical protein
MNDKVTIPEDAARFTLWKDSDPTDVAVYDIDFDGDQYLNFSYAVLNEETSKTMDEIGSKIGETLVKAIEHHLDMESNKEVESKDI